MAAPMVPITDTASRSDHTQWTPGREAARSSPGTVSRSRHHEQEARHLTTTGKEEAPVLVFFDAYGPEYETLSHQVDTLRPLTLQHSGTWPLPLHAQPSSTYPTSPPEETLATWSDYQMDQDSLQHLLTLSDGSSLTAESTWSVSQRASRAIDLCLGGVAVYSVDQDNIASDLTNGIYAAGGFLPTVDVIYSSISHDAAIVNGYVSTVPYTQVSNSLTTQYPFLPPQDAYRILLLEALDIQKQVSSRLAQFLSAPELTADNFGLYKKWEGKAVDLAIANATGYENQYWSCQFVIDGDGDDTPCPGYINVDETAGNPSPHLTDFSEVHWTLLDLPGFTAYLNSQLGSFDVTRNIDSCDTLGGGGGGGPDPGRRDSHSSVNRTIIASSRKGPLSKRTFGTAVSNATSTLANATEARGITKRADPLNPDPNCHTTWSGLLLIDVDKTFTNPKDIINGYIAATGETVKQYTAIALEPTTEPLVLMSLLQTTLTTISLGNDTIANTQEYITRTQADEAEQAAFEAEARRSVVSLVETIGLSLLSFIPGVGEIADFAVGGVDLASGISKVMDIADLAGTLKASSSRIARLLGSLRTDAAVVEAADAVEESLSVTALSLRGQLGKVVDQVQGNLATCFDSSLSGFVLDGLDLGISLAPTVSRRELWLGDDFVNLASRPSKSPCLWDTQIAPDLKISVKDYRAKCVSNNLQMGFPNPQTGSPTSVSSISFTECLAKATFPGHCQCDHLLEPDEVKTAIVKALSPAERKDLCSSGVFSSSRSAMKDILNNEKNLAGLWGTNTPGGKFNPNSIKNALLDGYKNGIALDRAFKKYSDEGRNLMYTTANDHIVQFDSKRQSVGDDIDELMHQWHASVAASGTDTQKAAFAKVYTPNNDGTKKSTFKALAEAHKTYAQGRIDALKKKETDLKNRESDTDKEADDGKDPKSQPKVPHNGAGDGGSTSSGGTPCGSQSDRAAKRRKI
ncbi:hypothetical protein C8R47DRAFT_1259936 [Mycena vitilis]|nr:hypothetical protein C8R47DRAFT_1259936 [Mycena vitilis]